MLSPRQGPVAALFDEDDRVSRVVAALCAAGVESRSLCVVARSSDRSKRLAARLHIESLEHARSEDALAQVLLDRGVDADRAIHFSSALGEGMLLLLAGDDVTPARLRILVDARADLGLANAGGIEQLIQLRAEQVSIGKTVVVSNIVTVRTDVITEVKSFDIELTREELVIERTIGGAGGDVETTRIPLNHEEATIIKTMVVTEEVLVRTEQVLEFAHIEESVRHEVLRVAESPDDRDRDQQ